MSTPARPELSKKSEYWINRHRYYELRHFCLQYPLWKKALASIDGYSAPQHSVIAASKTNGVVDPVFDTAAAREYYRTRIGMVDKAVQETDPVIAPYILQGILEGISYEALNAKRRVPCSKDVYYELYRKFFFVLSEIRQ